MEYEKIEKIELEIKLKAIEIWANAQFNMLNNFDLRNKIYKGRIEELENFFNSFPEMKVIL